MNQALPDISRQVVVQVSLDKGALAPIYATSGAAGMDLCSNEDCQLLPMERKRVGTGIRIAIPYGYEGQLRPRSGLALKCGLGMVNSVGTIDCDYRGEVGVLLINFGSEVVSISRGERIAQMVISPIAHALIEEVDGNLSETARGEGGFGSTGSR